MMVIKPYLENIIGLFEAGVAKPATVGREGARMDTLEHMVLGLQGTHRVR